ncbi:beta-phosphoglucomutase family hydrolase [Candidatus Saganbacteria bacterium CG08_land_8_20_14_0_20_45_16]|uniref:Beta-phosphoglucomutase n=1 Tax=Candidatus Saganbacteria bacterium CG08_land_8_20_14_0_20_45_16 TaxID=2014293 RepID=A0A2H0XXA4_UNCSA|nr:MAG: beta-phosphoglucomutase family hydrolase [Candidatus Saganbacteria bacterium CG08_land_8_20_14_0_20_45_16]
MIKGAIFDLDGVIVNTVPFHFKAWQKMFQQYGYDFTMADYLAKVDGRPRLAGVAAILTDLSPDEITKAGDIKQGYYLELLENEPLEIFESTIVLIKEMKTNKIKLVAASSSKNAVMILKKIKIFELFDANVSGADFKKGKPDPEIFLTAAKKIGLAPKECVVFEDAKSGVEAAFAGSFYCVGINRHNDRVGLQLANRVVKDLKEISLAEIVGLGKD